MSTASAAVVAARRRLMDLTQVIEAQPSPDGRTTAVSAVLPGPDGQSRADVHLASGGGCAPLAGDGCAARRLPRWLPDSRRLLVVQEDGDERGSALTLATAAGGDPARILDRFPGEIEDVLVAADGSAALLRVAEPGADRDGMNLGLPVERSAGPADPVVQRPGTGTRRLWRISLTAGRPAEPVGPTGLTVWAAHWNGGRHALAVVSRDAWPAGFYRAQVVLLDLAADSVRELSPSDPGIQPDHPALSPDGRYAAWAEGLSIVSGLLRLTDLATGAPVPVPALDDITSLHWSGPRTLWYAGWDGTGSRVGRLRLGADEVHHEELWHGEATLSGAGYRPQIRTCAAGRVAASVLHAPGTPPEAVTADVGTAAEEPPRAAGPAPAPHPVPEPDATPRPEPFWTPVTAFNAGQQVLDEGITTEPLSWQASDGSRVTGLLLHRADLTGPAPAAVLLHGGPAWLWSAGFAPGDVLGLPLALARAGYRVLLPNPRGSAGRGQGHARAVVGDLGGADLDEVFGGARALLDRGLAAPGRIAVLGHSYGGYLAALAAARGGLFAAAVVVSAPTDWPSFAVTSAIGGGYDDAYRITGGGHTDGPDIPAPAATPSPARERDPAPTPTLILHGCADRVTPVEQARALYRARLLAGHRDVELVLYPREGHEFTEPDHLLDACARTADWLDRHLVPDPDPTGGTS